MGYDFHSFGSMRAGCEMALQSQRYIVLQGIFPDGTYIWMSSEGACCPIAYICSKKSFVMKKKDSFDFYCNFQTSVNSF